LELVVAAVPSSLESMVVAAVKALAVAFPVVVASPEVLQA
jgi:hypothetical protein